MLVTSLACPEGPILAGLALVEQGMGIEGAGTRLMLIPLVDVILLAESEPSVGVLAAFMKELHFLSSFFLLDVIEVVDGPWGALQFSEGLAIAEREAAFEVDRPWEVERTVGVSLFHEVTVLLALAGIPRLLGFFLNESRSTGGGFGS